MHVVSTTALFPRPYRRIYISTVDGILTALNEQGQVLWRYSAREPLFSSSLKYGEVSVDGYGLHGA